MPNWLAILLREIFARTTAEDELNPPGVFAPYNTAIAAIAAAAAKPTTDAGVLAAGWKLFEIDGARRTSIDARAGVMMSAISLAATLVTGVGFTAFRDTSSLSAAALWAMAATLVISPLYLTRTALLLFRIQGRVVRNTPDPTDLARHDPGDDPRAFTATVLGYTVANYKVNNRVADQLWAAQKAFRNALCALVLGGVVTVVLMLFAAPTRPSALGLAQTLAAQAGCTDLPALKQDGAGAWQGTCMRAGAPSRVEVATGGAVTFKP